MCLIILCGYVYEQFWIEVDEYDLINDGTFWFCEREKKKSSLGVSGCVCSRGFVQSRPGSFIGYPYAHPPDNS